MISPILPPDPPPHLDDDAQCKWREIWPRLDHRRFDVRRDGEALEQYCKAWADIRHADREIENLMRVTPTSTDPGESSNQISRCYEQRLAAMDQLDCAGEKLGLSLDPPQLPACSNYSSAFRPYPWKLAAQDEGDKSTAPRRRRIWTFKRVWAALQRSNGNMAAAARLLAETYGVACAPAKISRKVAKSPLLREAIEDRQLSLLDYSYTAIRESATAGDADARRFLLCMLDPGYGGKPRYSLSNLGPVRLRGEPPPGDEVFADVVQDLLTPEELIELAQIAETVDARGSIDTLSCAEFARMKELKAKAAPAA
jgi:hypothetical protein